MRGLRSWRRRSRIGGRKVVVAVVSAAADVVIRLLILKHLFDWSYGDMERVVRANLVHRMFTRIDAGGRARREGHLEDRPHSGRRSSSSCIVSD
jgi:hypothetical protein